MTILIVEDDRDLLEVLHDKFLQEGFNVVSAVHGCDALEKLQIYPIDVVLTDVQMPVMNGMEFLKKARSIFKKIPIFIMSGGSRFEPEEFLRAGATDYMEKMEISVGKIAGSVKKAS